MNIDLSEIRALIRIATQRTGSPLHDEDLEQEATLKAVEAFKKQIEVRFPRAFLQKVVRDVVRDYWRRRRPAEDLDAVNEAHFAQAAHFEDDLDRRRLTELLRIALLRLDPGKRTTVDLFYVEGCSVVEIARLQQKSVSAVKMELLRARRLLAEIVRKLAKKGRVAATFP